MPSGPLVMTLEGGVRMRKSHGMTDRLPLSALLSQALVAYTIEFDNEFEQRAPHITSVDHGGRGEWPGPWLTSQVMYTNFIRYIRDEGTPVRDIQAMACLAEPAIKSALHHLEWWRYLTFAPAADEPRAKSRYRDLLVHLTPKGKQARDEWQPLNRVIDKRWRTRFSTETIDDLVGSLRAIAGEVNAELPDYLPVVQFAGGLRTKLVFPDDPPPQKRVPVARLDISGLLSRVLLALALEFESDSDVSLTVSANVLRVIEKRGTPLRDLPARGGVAKEGVTAAVNFLSKNGFVEVGSDKDKTVRLTAEGIAAQKRYATSLASMEKRWAKAFGKDTIGVLRESLEALDQPGKSGKSRLAEGIDPPKNGWRTHKRYVQQTDAYLRDPRHSLPHYPFISHRGGYPDGA